MIGLLVIICLLMPQIPIYIYFSSHSSLSCNIYTNSSFDIINYSRNILGINVSSDWSFDFHILNLVKIYYRCIVRFPIGLDFLFIPFTFLLHILLSWTSSLSISSLAISASKLSPHVFIGLSTGLLPSTLYSIHFFTQSSSPFLITCPYRLSLRLLMKVVIGSTSLLNSSFVLLSFNEIPHIHLIICISAHLASLASRKCARP